MLDNFSPEEGKRAYDRIKSMNPGIIVEASGGITEENITEYGWADVISMGSLTYGARALDFSMYIR